MTKRIGTFSSGMCLLLWACSSPVTAPDSGVANPDAAGLPDVAPDAAALDSTAVLCEAVSFLLTAPESGARVGLGGMVVEGDCDPAEPSEVEVELTHVESGLQHQGTAACERAAHPTPECREEPWGTFEYDFDTSLLPGGLVSLSVRRGEQTAEREILLTGSRSTVRLITDDGLPDHADAAVDGTIQAALNSSVPGDEVRLTGSGPYLVRTTLRVPGGVRLTSSVTSEDKEELSRVLATSDFVGPEMMVLSGGTEGSPTTVLGLHFDGAHVAWQIIGFERGAAHITIENNLLQRTKNDIGYQAETGFHHVDIVFGTGLHDVRLYGNELKYAGVKAGVGRENNPLTWSAIGAGVILYNSTSLDIGHNLVREVSTHGISIAGSRQVHIYNNRLEYVSRNVEWYDVSEVPVPLGDGITGYHNNAFTDVSRYESQEWLLEDNEVYHSGNHGIHVGGKGIVIRGGNVRFANQSGILLGDHRTADGGMECSQDTRVQGTRIRDTGTTGYLYRSPNRALLPSSLTQNVAVRGYDRHRASLTFVDLDILEEVYFDTRFASCMVE